MERRKNRDEGQGSAVNLPVPVRRLRPRPRLRPPCPFPSPSAVPVPAPVSAKCRFMSRTALLAGATGLVGGHCLAALLASPEYSHVTVLVRRSLGKSNAKLTERIVDFDALDPQDRAFAQDDVYVCLGTTIKVAGSKEKFRKVDHDYAVEVAKLAKDAGAGRLALVSSVDANAKSSSFYLRVKGETENDVTALGWTTVVIAQPSFLVGDRAEKRPGEKLAIVAAQSLKFALFGGLRKYRAIEAKSVATAMIDAMISPKTGVRILRYDELALVGNP